MSAAAFARGLPCHLHGCTHEQCQPLYARRSARIRLRLPADRHLLLPQQLRRPPCRLQSCRAQRCSLQSQTTPLTRIVKSPNLDHSKSDLSWLSLVILIHFDTRHRDVSTSSSVRHYFLLAQAPSAHTFHTNKVHCAQTCRQQVGKSHDSFIPKALWLCLNTEQNVGGQLSLPLSPALGAVSRDVGLCGVEMPPTIGLGAPSASCACTG